MAQAEIVLGDGVDISAKTGKYTFTKFSNYDDASKTITIPSGTDFLLVQQFYVDNYDKDFTLSSPVDWGIIANVGDSITINKKMDLSGNVANYTSTVTWATDTTVTQTREGSSGAINLFACKYA